MFAKQLKKLRMKKGLKQKELADYLHVSVSTVGMWEQGRNEPDVKRLEELADFFGVTVDYLLGREIATSTQEKTIEDTIKKLEEVTEQLKHIFRDQQ